MFERASNFTRLMAFIIDLILFGVFRFAFSYLSRLFSISRDITPDEVKLLEDLAAQKNPEEILGATLRIQAESGAHYEFILFFIIFLSTVIYLISQKGGTPGKLAMGLEIQDIESYQKPKWWQAALREFVGKTFLWPLTLSIGALLSLVTKNRRGIHDLIAGTAVRQKKGAL